jgi:hypothetical protein
MKMTIDAVLTRRSVGHLSDRVSQRGCRRTRDDFPRELE